MPFQMKIQPIDPHAPLEPARLEPVKPVAKLRLKRFFRVSVPEKVGAAEFEPSSACLDKMVQNFIEESHEKQSVKCGRSCFNRRSDDELDSHGGSGESDTSELLQSLVVCASVDERNLLADTAKIVEKNKICKRKDQFCRRIVTESLLALGYDASICKSRWAKSPSYPAGEYEYIDVFVHNERFLIDIDFRSEFEIARSTKTYRSILNSLPYIFVGKSDRLLKIIGVVSDGAKLSLKKKGMHVPPWRKAEYVKAKWLSPPIRFSNSSPEKSPEKREVSQGERNSVEGGELGFEESVFEFSEEVERSTVERGAWKSPEMKFRSSWIGGEKVVTGLTSVVANKISPTIFL